MQRTPPWAELLQLLPVISLAFPIITRGTVELSELAPAFVVATGLAVGVTTLVAWRGHVLNPILLGVAGWLALGAAAFAVPVAPLATLLTDTQAFTMFALVLLVGGFATARLETGFVGCRHPDAAWVRQRSLVLLGLAVVAVAWAWAFRHDVRLGGGLPFIALNVVRRVMIARG